MCLAHDVGKKYVSGWDVIDDTIALFCKPITADKVSFHRFCLANGINDSYNLTKYEKQYKEYLKTVEEFKKWFAENVRGKLVVKVWYADKKGHMEVLYDNGRNLDEDIVKNGYAFFTEEEYQKLLNYTKQHGLDDSNIKRLWEAQQYAKEHKLGVWAIEFPNQ